MYVWHTVLVRKGNKDIIKVVLVSSVDALECFEASKIHFGPKITKTTTFIKICVHKYRTYIFKGGTENSQTKSKIS